MTRPHAPHLVLHVGMPQSGGTMIQRALTALRPQLRAHGVAYLSHDQLLQTEAVAGWLANVSPKATLAEAFSLQVRHLVQQELRDTTASSSRRAPIVLLSSHGLLGREHLGPGDAEQFRPASAAAINQIVDALDPSGVTVVLYTHRQDRLAEYSYNQYVMAGGTLPFQSRFPPSTLARMDYVELVERISALPLIERVVVKPYELMHRGLPEAVEDFLGLIGLRGHLDLAPAGRLTLGRMYSAQGVQVALAMNRELETDAERADVRKFLLSTFAIVTEPDSRILTSDERAAILAVHATRNVEFWRSHRPDLIDTGYRDDQHTDALVHQRPAPRRDLQQQGRDHLQATVAKARARARSQAGRLRRRLRATLPGPERTPSRRR